MRCSCPQMENTGLETCKDGSTNEKVSLSVTIFSGVTRKAIKLLSKQYLIISINQEEPEYWGEEVIEKPLIIKYQSYWGNSEVFEWIIQPHEIKFN